MYVVYVLDKNKKSLMPTTRFGHVRKLLNEGKAKAVSTKPFVIQLLYDSTNYVQPLYGGTDPGRTNIGEAVVNKKGEVLFSADVISRNKEIPKLMSDRARHRRASRYGERQRRKRRAIKNGTTTTFPNGRKLPGFKGGVLALKDIINTESKFNNRKRPEGWLTPTARQCIQTHINVIKIIRKILPVNNWTLEYNKFAFMKLENGKIYGRDYQNGRMRGFDSVEDYVNNLQEGHCVLCDNKIDNYHHIVPRYLGGSNTPENLVGLCKDCHALVHTNKKVLDKIGKEKKYAGTSILNTAMPFIYKELIDLFGESNINLCTGQDTFAYRSTHNIEKRHCLDAVCIACIGGNIVLNNSAVKPFTIKQFRNHNRAIVHSQRERIYKLDGKTIAKNRKPRSEQPKNIPALSDWYEDTCNKAGIKQAQALLSRVKVNKSRRWYNDISRILPGAVFIYNNGRYILRGRNSGGRYYTALGSDANILASRCRIISQCSFAVV